MKKTSKKLKIIIFVATILVVMILAIVIIENVIKENNLENKEYLETISNADSNLIASYIKEGVTIGGITGTLKMLDTSDATATEEDVLEGKTFYAGSNDIKTGTMKSSYVLKTTSTTYNPNSWNGSKTINVESSFGIPSDIADTLSQSNFVASVKSLNWTRSISATNITTGASISYNSESHNLTISHSSRFTEAIITSITVVAFWIE